MNYIRAIYLIIALFSVSTLSCQKEKPQVEVGVIPPGMVSPFHSQIVAGAREAAKKLGWKLDVLAPERETDFMDQVRIVEDLIERGVDALSVNSIDDRAIVTAVRKANSVNIPFFVHNSLTPLPSGEVTAYIGYDQREGGRKMGRKAVELLGGKGKIAILEGIPGFHTTERKGGFMEIVEKYPEIEVLASQPADWEREKAMNVAENILQAYPDIDLFYGVSDEMALGASQAALAAGKKIFILGIDGNPNAVQAIKEGRLTATLGTNPRLMGAKIIETMNRFLNGEKVEKFVVTETVVVDRTNADEYLRTGR